MKNLFIKILFTCTITLLSLVGISSMYDFFLRQNRNLKTAYVQEVKVGADILIHGTCEALHMVLPPIIEKHTGLKTYNLASNHSDFADNYLDLYFYLKNNPPPKYLFLFVTPESMDRNYNTFNTYKFAAFTGDTEVGSALKKCDPEYYKWSAFPFMKYAYYSNKVNFDALQGVKHYLKHRQLPYFVDGYEPLVEKVWDKSGEKIIQLYPNGYSFEWDGLREKYLRKIIELSKKHTINLYLYESPMFKEIFPYQLNRAEITNKIKIIAGEYGIKYVQFENMKISESREYFISISNANIKGGRIFSDSLGRYIKQHCMK